MARHSSLSSCGFAVYAIDQPARGPSAHPTGAAGSLRRSNRDRILQNTPDCSRKRSSTRNSLARASAATPVFDQFLAQEMPSLWSYPRQQVLNRNAAKDPLDTIGPSILLTHSQAGAFRWLTLDTSPHLVSAIVPIEPNGPPVRNLIATGRRGSPFMDGASMRHYGPRACPLTYARRSRLGRFAPRQDQITYDIDPSGVPYFAREATTPAKATHA